MKYMMLIYQGSTPLPQTPEWDALSDEVKGAVFADYRAINEDARVTTGEQMEGPEAARTVRARDGRPLVTDGPFADTKEAVGGYMFVEADSFEDAAALAARVPAARMGGAVEVRSLVSR